MDLRIVEAETIQCLKYKAFKKSIFEETVLVDRRLKEMAVISSIFETNVRLILRDHLVMNRFNTRWIPRLLSSLNSQRLDEYARSFLNMCEDDPKPILESIVT